MRTGAKTIVLLTAIVLLFGGGELIMLAPSSFVAAMGFGCSIVGLVFLCVFAKIIRQ